MPTRRNVVGLALAIVCRSNAWAEPVMLDPIGPLDNFYRGTQLQSNGLRAGIGIEHVPDFLTRSSFPYRRRPYSEEVPFADKLSMARFLGGYNPAWTWGEQHSSEAADLAYVDRNGRVQYRFGLIKPRLDRYLELGYRDLIISLDNVPWDLAAFRSQGPYGQNAPPRNYEEWQNFIGALCGDLKDTYGAGLVGKWAFRLGTEPNGGHGATSTFNGSHDEFVKLYDLTARVIKHALPSAPFGPGEFAGPIPEPHAPPNTLDYVKLARHCASAGVPFDFLANSSHGIPRWVAGRLEGIDPRERVETNLSSYQNILGDRNIPIYIFQFGILQSEFEVNGAYLSTDEPGGRGAAWTFHVLLEMKRREKRLRGIWHWNTMDTLGPTGDLVEIESPRALLCGNGWLYCILDSCLGYDSYVFTPAQSRLGTVYKGLVASAEKRTVIVISSFNMDRNVSSEEAVAFSFPSNLLRGTADWQAKMVYLTERNSIFSRVKSDLSDNGLLKQEYAGHPLLAPVRQMGSAGALEFVRSRYPTYEALQEESLTLKRFSGEFHSQNGLVTVKANLMPDSLMAIVFA